MSLICFGHFSKIAENHYASLYIFSVNLMIFSLNDTIVIFCDGNGFYVIMQRVKKALPIVGRLPKRCTVL